MEYSKRTLSSQNGFILLTALMACLILFALTFLILNLSTSDLRVSSQTVGQKKAMVAAEAGIHRMMQNFDPQNLATTVINNVQVDSANDPKSIYSISAPTTPTSGPLFLPLTGYSIGGGQTWGRRRYDVNVTGSNTTYHTTVTIGVGIGYGPIEISTMMR
jgi:Tfp pilus assembly protein PilX